MGTTSKNRDSLPHDALSAVEDICGIFFVKNIATLKFCQPDTEDTHPTPTCSGARVAALASSVVDGC